MMAMFHHTVKYYEPGEVIAAANWGRVVLGMGSGHPFHLRERIWERVRTFHAPTAPSRYSCAFAYDDVEVADAWRRGALQGNCVPWLYRVEPRDPAASVARAYMDHLDGFTAQLTAGAGIDVEAVAKDATAYWQGAERGSDIEVLVGSDLVVREVMAQGGPIAPTEFP